MYCKPFATYLDGFEKTEVEGGDDEEGYAKHGEKVCDENVVARVRLVNSQCSRTEHRHLCMKDKMLKCEIGIAP